MVAETFWYWTDARARLAFPHPSLRRAQLRYPRLPTRERCAGEASVAVQMQLPPPSTAPATFNHGGPIESQMDNNRHIGGEIRRSLMFFFSLLNFSFGGFMVA